MTHDGFTIRVSAFRAMMAIFLFAIASCGPNRVEITPPPAHFEYAPCPEGMTLVRAGSFWFGPSVLPDPDRDENPQPVEVVLPAFCIDTLPVMDEPGGPKRRVTWLEALKQCRERGPGYDLCTEYQWERAARGDRMARYPYGDTYQAGRCPEATDTPMRAAAACQSDLGVIGMTAGAGEWTQGGNWVWRELENTQRRRAVVRGLGKGSNRHAMSRMETYAEPTPEERKAGRLPVLDDVLENTSGIPDTAAPLDRSGKIIVSPMSYEEYDAMQRAAKKTKSGDESEGTQTDSGDTGPQKSSTAVFSPLRRGTQTVSIFQGFRCCRAAQFQPKGSDSAE